MSRFAFLPQALRLVRRELRGGLRGFGVFLACLFLGVFAISAIGSFSAAARSGLLADAGALLGGDLEIRLSQRSLTDEQRAFIEQFGLLSSVLEMRTMATAVATQQSALVELKAVDGAYPLYGELPIVPEQKSETALAGAGVRFGALVEQSFLQRFAIAVGDRVKVGAAEFTVRGILQNEPDRTVRAFHLGPRLLVSQAALRATDLLQPGSLVTYRYRLKLPDREQVEAVSSALQQRFPDAGWRLRDWRKAAPRVRFFLDRMSTNLTLLGLCALLVGGLGVSGAVRGYLNGKLEHIATMKCLGASSRVVFTAYLLQVLLLGFVGSSLGLLLGAAVPWLIARFAGNLLPIPLQAGFYPQVLLVSALFGLLIALLFSLKELGIARRVPPAMLFRGYVDSGRKNPGRTIWLAVAASGLALALVALFSSSDKQLAGWFILGAAICFLLFRVLATLVIRLVAKLPQPGNPRVRLALANIKRPGAPAVSIIFSLGLGLTALVMIALVQANLNDMVRDNIPADAPDFFLLDIQPQQVAAMEGKIAEFPGARLERSPTLRGRITFIDGVSVADATIAPNVRWAVRGDRFFSYSGTLPSGTVLTAGEWWPEDYSGPPLLSLTADLAEGFGVGLGDSISVNILGREVTAEIANIREVDWSTLQLNFALLFAPGLLESAPQTHLAAVHLPDGVEEQYYRRVTTEFPNISLISTAEVLKNVSLTLGRIGAAFQGMAAVALLTGFLVLAGAVSADQHRRIQDAVIFKVCGATRRDILTTFAAEFALLGLIAGMISALTGGLAAFAILRGPLDVPFSPHPEVILLTLAAGIGLTLLLGLSGTWKALGKRPAGYLRHD
ncbi:putative ABC transport system permease protein [Malonomonas rubra DSM 5091]|uniref:Putative ABC transport system permease protein n=1 Tax=Malonomonas rubra DSM 5091 TaxID=1122189 RepID=A0A1M6IYS8_MALRU|nr:FtsX-like permease family protein [Malonomonas rubra]SHJ39595.1 putative ABC transport system permease protein [Malonomonas rubra DSM 5091]